MLRTASARVVLIAVACALTAACQMPRLPGIGGGHYQVTDPESGAVWYTDDLRREARGVVEFRDGRTGAWISVADADVEAIDRAQFRAKTAL